MSEIQVSELTIYPVKSLAQISLKESSIDNFGLKNDRRWMVVDEQGKYITQRQQSRMCLIKVELRHTNSQLDAIYLSAPQIPSLIVTIPSLKKSQLVTIWHDQCKAFDCGQEVSDWISEFLNFNCKLVYFSENEIRQVDLTYAKSGDRTAFSDGFPILLISQASLDSLNSKLDLPVPMKRFRPNIVVTGCDAFEEDSWKLISIDGIELRVVKPCSRCVIPNIDTETGERGKEPIKTLLTFRQCNNKIYFGQNVIANSMGSITVGSSVKILE